MVTLGLKKLSSSVKGADLHGTCREMLHYSAVSMKYFFEISRMLSYPGRVADMFNKRLFH